MIDLNKNTKKAQGFIDSYFNANCSSVDFFYGNCSYKKRAIEKEIIEKMYKMDCSGYRILGGSSSFFTCGYTSKNQDVLFIETWGNTYRIAL